VWRIIKLCLITDNLKVTQSLGLYECLYKGRRIILVDTPGFDDSERPDDEIFKELAMWLSEAYNHKVYLTGLIYMLAITQPRLTRSAVRIQKTIGELVGPDMKGFICTTTMWNRTWSQWDAEAKEDELFGTRQFRQMFRITSDSPRFRYGGSRGTAELIVDYLIRNARPQVLAIQQELSRGLNLRHTQAGRILMSEINQQRDRYERNINILQMQQMSSTARGDYESGYTYATELGGHMEQYQALENRALQLQADQEALLTEYDRRRAEEWKDMLEVFRREESRLVQENAMKVSPGELGTPRKEVEELLEDVEDWRTNPSGCDPM
jgi:hypothetical protein